MIGLYFGGQWFQTRFGNQFGNIELDLNLDEGHEWKAEATMNPVEEGAPITDHVIEQSDKLSLKGFISDTPLTITSANIDLENRTQPVFDLLRELIKAREPVTVYTKYWTYADMVITSISIPRTAGQGEALEFSIEFVNIRKVATQMVDVPEGISRKKDKKGDKATGKKAEPQKYKGKTETEDLAKRYPEIKTPPKDTGVARNLGSRILTSLGF